MCRVAGTHEVASAPGDSSGSLGFVGNGCSTGLGACVRGYSVPHQCSSELEPRDLIITRGSAML